MVDPCSYACFIRYAPRWDCGSEYHIIVELLNQKKKPIMKFAPETVYFGQWNDQQWNRVRRKHESIQRYEPHQTNLFVTILYPLPDGACISELWSGSEIRPVHPWRQGHAVLGWMVRDPCHPQLHRDLSDWRHLMPQSCFLPQIAKIAPHCICLM